MADAPVDFWILAGAGSPARDFKAGEVIFKQGDAARELFIVQSGAVEIWPRQSPAGDCVCIRHFRRDGAHRYRATQCDGRSCDGRQGRADCREAVSVPHQQHTAFRLEHDADHGAPIAQRQYQLVSER